LDAKGWPDHFFEVELRKVIRHRNDALLNTSAVQEFLSQVAPVPFSPSFRYADRISDLLRDKVELGNLDIRISGSGEPIYRPHRNEFAIGSTLSDSFTELQPLTIPGLERGLAGIGWVLHHRYRGAIATRAGVKGLRLRTGNIQVGDDTLLQELFPEARFNSWAVGEIHVIDSKIIPNGRRDQYEQNGNYAHLLGHLRPLAHEISSRCRASSLKRNWLRQFDQHHAIAKERISALKQGAISAQYRSRFETEISDAVTVMEKLAGRSALEVEARAKLRPAIGRIRRSLESVRYSNNRAPALARLTPSRRRSFEAVICLIYECSSNASSAKRLVDKILAQLDKEL
jgi:molecular chaperone HtpG